MTKGLVSLRVARLRRIGGAAVLAWWAVICPAVAESSASAGLKDSLRLAQADSSTPAPSPASPQRETYAISDLEQMLAPIALYPDPLLLLIFEASAFPLQIVQADRWLIDNKDAVERGDFSAVDAQPWEASVKALIRFPEVVEMLADYLDWTESLGAAFALQPSDVSTTVQLLRAQAEKAGNLQSTPQQAVRVTEESGSRVIYIAPANPERIYVPVYDSLSKRRSRRTRVRHRRVGRFGLEQSLGLEQQVLESGLGSSTRMASPAQLAAASSCGPSAGDRQARGCSTWTPRRKTRSPGNATWSSGHPARSSFRQAGSSGRSP